MLLIVSVLECVATIDWYKKETAEGRLKNRRINNQLSVIKENNHSLSSLKEILCVWLLVRRVSGPSSVSDNRKCHREWYHMGNFQCESAWHLCLDGTWEFLQALKLMKPGCLKPVACISRPVYFGVSESVSAYWTFGIDSTCSRLFPCGLYKWWPHTATLSRE